MKFKIIGDSLIYIDEGLNIVKSEHNYDTIEIEAPHYRNGIDSMSLSFRLTATSAEDHSKSACQVLMKKEISESKILLIGSITSDFSSIIGKTFFMVTGIDSNGRTAVFDSTRPIEIRDNISLASLPIQSTAEQLFNQAQLEVEKAIAAAERAEKASQIPAPAKIYPATKEQLGGIKSGNDISIDDNGIVTVNFVNGKAIGKSVPENAVFTDTVYTLPKATTEILGGVKVDGKTITADEDGTISTLESENLKAEIAELKSIIGFTDSDIIGLHADFENNIFTRLGAAVGLNGGSDFDKFSMYGGRRRCNVLDDGTITAYYGDENFVEDGSNGQVMVYQPKFYYKVVPLKLDPITDGYGYHLRCANYYISAVPKDGFKLHPAFYDENGNPTEYILFSAYEGSVFDTSENIYLQHDEQVTDFSADKLCSIAGSKPCSGRTQNLTRANAEMLAKNRGNGWHIDTIKTVSANQLLMVIEFASFNLQKSIGLGMVNISDISGKNCASATGLTSVIGNITGISENNNGNASISYRGMENPWGNIWKLVNGLNNYMDGKNKLHGYICSNYSFSENVNSENYYDMEFTFSQNDGYVSAFGYNYKCDWLFLASETSEKSNLPVGDYCWFSSASPNTWYFPLFGGSWNYNSSAGAFILYLNNISGHIRGAGGRIIYVPQGRIE